VKWPADRRSHAERNDQAARAGDAGKGFPVIASELQGLANQTTRTTKTIASQVEVIQAIASQKVVRNVQEAAQRKIHRTRSAIPYMK
jgi:methyl-accepting chemotaxis protein